MDQFTTAARLESEAKKIVRRQWFWLHAAVFVGGQIMLIVLWANLSRAHPWFWYPLVGWLIILIGHAAVAFVVRTPDEVLVDLERRQSAVAPTSGGPRAR